MQINKLMLHMLATPFLFSAIYTHADYKDERYGLTALTAQAQNVQSCTPGINAISRQITTGSTDIQGPLPFIRTYETALQLGFNPNFRTNDAKVLDRAFANTYLEVRALFGAGWSHNYDYRLQTVGTQAFTLNLPGGGLPMTFAKQSDGSIKMSNPQLVPITTDMEYKITDNNLTVIVNINGTEITFQSLSGSRGLFQNFQATQVKYPGGKVINMTYSPVSRSGAVAGYLITGVSDNRGNSLKINRNNMTGSDTSTIALQLQGMINSVESAPNTLNKQTVTYSYEIQPVVINGATKNIPKLMKAVSTTSGTEDYTYSDYVHQGLFKDSAQSIYGVTMPILSKYAKSGQALFNWETTADTISSYTDKTLDYSSLKFIESTLGGTLTLTGPRRSTTTIGSEVFTVTNSTDGSNRLFYNTTSTSPCLSYNGKPVKSLTYSKKIRRLSEVVDKVGNKTALTFDVNNRLTSFAEAVGSSSARTTTASYSTVFDIPSTIKRGNLTQTNTINTLGQITKSVQTSSQTGSTSKATDYTYLANGLLSSVDGPRTGTTDKVSFTYDSYGNKASETQIVNGTTRKTSYVGYNSLGQPERIVYPTGLVDKFVYNADGTVASKTTGVGTATTTITGKTTTYTYDALKRLSSETNPDGEKISYAYDVAGRLIKKTLPDGSLVNKTYHGNGIVASEKLTDSTGATLFNQSSTTLDSNRRPLRAQIGTNSNWYWVDNTYDLNGNLTQTTSTLGITEKWTYDALNRVLTHTDGLDNIDKKTYDLQDNTLTALDALNAGTNPYSYRNGKVLTKEVNTDYGTKSYIYDEADLLTQSIYGVRKCDNSNIDALERIGQVNCTHATSTTAATLFNNFVYNYDQTRFGRLDKVTSPDPIYGVETTYTYDNYDRITGKSQTSKAITQWGGTNPTLNVGYTYTIGDKISSMTLPSGRKLAFTYDATKKNQLTNVTLDGTALIRAITYDAGGQMTGWNWGTGAASYTWVYDAEKRGIVKTINNKNNSGAINYTIYYSFDLDGRITNLALNNGIFDTFTYSNADRLLKETRSQTIVNDTTDIYAISYTYDKNGNRLSLNATGAHQQPQGSVSYTYTGNKLATIAGTAASHTANAELIYGGFTPTYDYAGNRRYDKTTGGTSTSPQYFMTYNHKNERTIRAQAGDGLSWKATAIHFVYDENSHLIGEYNASGTPLVEYVWLGDKPVAAIYGSGTTAKTYWIVTDAQNTPRRLIDAANGSTTVWAWDSTAFGVGAPSIQTVKFNLRFPGQYYDELTKQHYNHNRFYNPALGRYMEPDPIGLEGGLNPYIYVAGNPISGVDPTGLDCISGTCSSGFEQGMYDWWPGYKAGTGLYNSISSGSNQFSFWEGVDFLAVFSGAGAKVLQFGDNVTLNFMSKFSFKIPTTRPLGSKLEYVDDIFANPELLKRVKSPDQLKSVINIDKNYVEGIMKRTRSADKGFTLRELAPDGKNVTDRYIQYHPGSVRHYNGNPYWKISSGKNGTTRFPVE
ncbi:RHS repeat domain-containing protein [Acinetobacter haemolyticus]|uniref:RHS repeat domain-containing protein n=1 Tax=Acinetobacter haemolyticus TaxID=29430 RepID=UPI0024DEA0AC|nr:RHS repeat-associated core domain-containing protein [Acinetobacter haemolyticus]